MTVRQPRYSKEEFAQRGQHPAPSAAGLRAPKLKLVD